MLWYSEKKYFLSLLSIVKYVQNGINAFVDKLKDPLLPKGLKKTYVMSSVFNSKLSDKIKELSHNLW